MTEYPIPKHDTWDIKDSSKIQTYMDCPRKYFYQYMLGWRRIGGGLHLDFGGALHGSFEHFNLIRKEMGRGHRLTDEEVSEGYFLFLEEFRKNHPPDEDLLNAPKNPDNAKLALKAYAQEYNVSDGEEEILHPETAGKVMVDRDRFLHFKMDLIKRDDRGISPRDYKTGQRAGDLWVAQFEMKTQMGAYIHAAKCLFPDEPVWGIEIRGIFFYKGEDRKRKYGKIDFKDVSVRKDRGMMEVWRSNTIKWMDKIDIDTECLGLCDPDDPTLKSFPLDTESCTKYGVCPYHDFCTTWPNPLSRCHETPMGFEVQWWDPSHEDGRDVKNKIEVTL